MPSPRSPLNVHEYQCTFGGVASLFPVYKIAEFASAYLLLAWPQRLKYRHDKLLVLIGENAQHLSPTRLESDDRVKPSSVLHGTCS